MPAYADEDGVDPDRGTETFAEVVLELDTPRWQGTPFVLRAGKAMRARRKEAVVHLRAMEPGGSPGCCASASTAPATSPCSSPARRR